MSNNNRREFLKKSLLGISGITLLPSNVRSGVKSRPPDLPSRMLGNTGIKTPLISMGTAGATTPAFIRAGFDAGIKLFFSATYYGEGNNERLVGEGLKGLTRDTFVVGTAVPPDGLDMRTGKFIKAFDTQAYVKKADESLKRFGLDHVDIFLFPFAGKREMVLDEGVLKAMEQLKKQGKTRFVGIASHSDVEEALIAAADSRVYEVAMIAYNFKSINKETLYAAMSKAAKAGIGLVAMKSTAGAFDTRGGPQLNSNAALKWVLQNKDISSIVSGMSTFEELQKNVAMIQDIRITDQELKDLNLAGIESMPSLYCHQCRTCIPQCTYNLDIPTIMRSYMYAYGYKDVSKAWHTLSEVEIPGNPCGTCSGCNIKCSAGFDIRSKILDVARLKDVPKDFVLG